MELNLKENSYLVSQNALPKSSLTELSRVVYA